MRIEQTVILTRGLKNCYVQSVDRAEAGRAASALCRSTGGTNCQLGVDSFGLAGLTEEQLSPVDS